MSAAPDPLKVCHSAVFLDFDGTLVEFCDHPEAVVVSDAVRTLLTTLDATTDGALAIVSGRRIEALDRLLTPLRFAAAGLHGLERRSADGRRDDAALDDGAVLAPITAELETFCRTHAGTFVEAKGFATALHYRRAPAHAAAARALLEKAIAKGAKSPYTFAAYSKVLNKPGERSKAFQMIDKAIAIDPLEPEFYYAKGRMLGLSSNEKDIKEAIRLHSLAFELNPESWKYLEAAEELK